MDQELNEMNAQLMDDPAPDDQAVNEQVMNDPVAAEQMAEAPPEGSAPDAPDVIIYRLQQEIEALETAVNGYLTEARGVAWTEVFGLARDDQGKFHEVKLNITARSAISCKDASDGLLDALTSLKKKNIFPYRRPLPSQPTAPEPPRQTGAPQAAVPQQPAMPQAPGAPQQPVAPQPTQQPAVPQQPAAPQGDQPKTGTGLLKSITVDAQGKVSFEVEGLRWPLKDSRGPVVIAGLFDQSLGWTPGHFQSPAIYTQANFGNLLLDWAHEGKYYNVKLIHA